MPIHDINGEPFNIELGGTEGKPALMFSNSLSSNLSMWDPQAEALGKRFRIVRYDSRGHGKSVVSEGPYSIAQLGRDALAIMDALGLKKVHWCGLSKGGMVGMWLLANAPERLNKVILANTAAAMPPPDLWNGRIHNVRKNGMQAIAPITLDRWFTKRFQEADPATVDRVREMILSTPPEGNIACAAAIRDMDQRDSLRKAKNPVLVIAGKHDPSTTTARAKEIKKAIKGAKLVVLDAAHISNLEQPKAFTKAVSEFLKGK
ncbi:3-oxoadipate enol-lactonase [Terrarubrum flagellatum]|uniref:3-oxoadipate enol-lactonase n=1 Tax=Terrirubrum flagellatum TaxID=2895980 RepID=UPI003144E842